MAKFVNFVYSMIIFLSLLVVAMNAKRNYQCDPCFGHPDDMINFCPPGTAPKCFHGLIKCVPIMRGTNRMFA
ncbi:putative Late nodulin [Medicago truncatula]|uniref:Nodule Cysteine-Rich (NCR) secreted peptide n=1 Tax=Medicago truncatula TaxID=3880 RepID=A0A072UTM9_MEDTR|nr:Nodule Cysteine-Rich (NCR) secreted peptide [Medicago truncatula]RHN65586.1 putative Late nodulin [Medicago truncatula]